MTVRKPRKRKSYLRLGCLIVGLSVSTLIPLCFWMLLQKPSVPLGSPVQVIVTRGEGAYVIGQRLEKSGLIRNAWCFAVASRLRRHPILPGGYTLRRQHSAIELLRLLEHGGAPESISITIPEGFTLKQIAKRASSIGLVKTPEMFIQAAKGANPKLVAGFPLPPGSLEGYLYPDTYFFAPNSDVETVINKMIRQFEQKFYVPRREAILRSGHTLHEIVTIASMIEREAEVPEDRATIAGVIENRLRKGMRLQIDATVIYALGDHKNRVVYNDLKIDSRYNTYKHSGLPPGPIASPGLESLIAALYPEQNEFLYYVMGTARGHVFAKTELEHNRNVAAYRRFRAERTKEGLSH